MQINKFIKKKPFIIAGPCSAESESQLLSIANSIKDYIDVFRAGVWKPRTSPSSFPGVGKNALRWLNRIQRLYGIKVATEVATPKHVELCLEAEIDILWIGARTTVNPFYVQEIAESLKGVNIPVFIKNPIHPELGLWLGAFERLEKSGIKMLGAIHRGVYSYKKSAFRNDPKWELPIRLREKLPDIPVICDPSHIAGKRSLIEDVSQTAMDIDLDGLMIETHNNPEKALSDSNQQILPANFKKILKHLVLRDSKLRDEKFKKELLGFRNEIDKLDFQLIELLNKRKCIVQSIANFKKKNKLTIFQIERWYEILSTRKNTAEKLDINQEMVSELFELIHKYSILTQTKIMR